MVRLDVAELVRNEDAELGRASRSSAVSQITIRLVGPIPKNSAFSARVRRLASFTSTSTSPTLRSRKSADLGGERTVA